MSGDITLNFDLLAWQTQVWNDPTRFQIVAAGRRTGKSRIACYKLITEALSNAGCDVFYIAPTQGQARDIMWNLMLESTANIRVGENVNQLQIRLINGSRISLKGSDRPDTMRGVKLRYAVLDEYADMKPTVWELIIRPALSDLQGGAMFIGTPMGRNHFYDLYQHRGHNPAQKDYKSWHFRTYDNPFIPRAEIEAAKADLSSFAFRQEYLASFEAQGSEIFLAEWIVYGQEPKYGDYYIAVDLGGFRYQGMKQNRKLDDSAIAVVKVSEEGWWVSEIISGRWSTDETADMIFDAVQKYNPVSVGIEKGISQQAVMSPLFDRMQREDRHFHVEDLSHGNQNKTDRIRWALEGRFEHGRIVLNNDPSVDWMKFLDQLFQFPDRLTHDDTVDALAYIDQLAKVAYNLQDYAQESYEDYEFEVLDDTLGF